MFWGKMTHRIWIFILSVSLLRNLKRAKHSIRDQVHTTKIIVYLNPLEKNRKKEKNHLFKLSADKPHRILNNARCPKMYGKIKIFPLNLRSKVNSGVLVSLMHLQFRSRKSNSVVKSEMPSIALITVGILLSKYQLQEHFEIAINSESIWILSGQKQNMFDVLRNGSSYQRLEWFVSKLDWQAIIINYWPRRWILFNSFMPVSLHR